MAKAQRKQGRKKRRSNIRAEVKAKKPDRQRALKKQYQTGVRPGDDLFRAILELNGVVYPYVSDGPEPANLKELMEIAGTRRASIEGSPFQEKEWLRNFGERNHKKANEEAVQEVVAEFLGDVDIPHVRNELFANIEPFNMELARPKPDHFDGVEREALRKVAATSSLDKFISPSVAFGRPHLPNFFIEWKGPRGDGLKLQDQAVYNGILGARAIFALESYVRDQLAFNNEAYTISVSYASQQTYLSIHCVHITRDAGGSPKYVVTLLTSFNVRRDYKEAITTLRNLRDYACKKRNELISKAEGLLVCKKRASLLGELKRLLASKE